MKIKAIVFDDESAVKGLTFEISLPEAIYLAKLLGCQTGTTAEGIFHGGADLNSELYSCLTGEFFNRFYDDGVNDAAREA